MNTKTKRRLMVVTGLIVIVAIAVLAVVGGAGAARGITVAQALEGAYAGERVQVTGSVADDSYEFADGGLTFDIVDEEGSSATLHVRYEGAASSTFGNGVTAICTGTLSTGEDGEPVLAASEMVTQCPSKYESATDALGVAALLDYGESIVGTTVKVAGTVQEGTLSAAGTADARFVMLDSQDGAVELPVVFGGALPDSVTDGTSVVVTGSLSQDGSFNAADVAQEG